MKELSIYCGMFHFENEVQESGTFSIIANALSIFAAEKIFRKHLRDWLSGGSSLPSGTRIYILDIIEASHLEQPVLFQLKKEHKEHKTVFFSALPFPQPHVQNHTISMPDNKELFLTVE